MHPFLSLCMIVKNEEKVIDRCLSSVAHLVDEIIIVDTGSNDKTKKIVQQFTEHIYDFVWEDDFSAARNFAASKASGKWLIVLDADEYVDEENFREFIKEIKDDKDKFDTYEIKILNFAGQRGETLLQNYHHRVYKNNGEIIYYRKIHEQFTHIYKDNNFTSKRSSLVIFHSGYLNNTVQEKDKQQRNKQLLDKELLRGKNKAFDYYNLGNEYFSLQDYSKALECYKKSYQLQSDFRVLWVSSTLMQIVNCLIHQQRYNDALTVIYDAEQVYSETPEFQYLKGEIYYLKGQIEDAKLVFNYLLNNQKKYNNVILRPDWKDQMPYKRLGEISLYENNYEEAIYNYISVLNINKYCKLSIEKVLFLLNKFHSNEEISNFLENNQLIDEMNIIDYVKICFDLGNPELSILLLNGTKNDFSVLYKVAEIKKIALGRTGNLYDFIGSINEHFIQELNKSGWLNIIDIFTLNEYLEESFDSEWNLNVFKQDPNFEILFNLKDNSIAYNRIDEGVFIVFFRIFTAYKRFDYVNLLLKYATNLSAHLTPTIAAILYENGFKVEGLQLYEKGNWDTFSKEDFLNIISSLLETENELDASQVAEYARALYPDDFRFYKVILEYPINEDTVSRILPVVSQRFPKSTYMEKYYI
ncbi:glycosyltransferase [Priestia megaterium]|uniref:glycosyltransferase n=1 Tax=Priestia megaterium TaxID=1404 RepID=UPI002E22AE04|nr:glycosyltransferase [Priestia megaterium]